MKTSIKKYLPLLILLLLLNSCLKRLDANVSVFQNLPESSGEVKFAFLLLKDQNSTLEYEAYKKMITEKLSQNNFKEVPMENADLLISFMYSIGDKATHNYSYPIYGHTGGGTSSTHGRIDTDDGFAIFSETTTFSPTLGVVGTRFSSRTTYLSKVSLNMIDGKQFKDGKIKSVYESKVSSRGSSSQIAEVMPTMIEALFKDFPMKSGSTKSYKLFIKKIE